MFQAAGKTACSLKILPAKNCILPDCQWHKIPACGIELKSRQQAENSVFFGILCCWQNFGNFMQAGILCCRHFFACGIKLVGRRDIPKVNSCLLPKKRSQAAGKNFGRIHFQANFSSGIEFCLRPKYAAGHVSQDLILDANFYSTKSCLGNIQASGNMPQAKLWQD